MDLNGPQLPYVRSWGLANTRSINVDFWEPTYNTSCGVWLAITMQQRCSSPAYRTQ